MILEALLVGVTMTSGWLVAAVVLGRRRARREHGGARAREALVEFAEHSLELDSAHSVLAFAGEAAQVIFGSRRAVAFEPAAVRGEWEAVIPGGEPLESVPPTLRGVFGWFRHNALIAGEGDLGQPRFGAMRAPLRQVMARYEVDLLLPLVRDQTVHAVLGLQLGRPPHAMDRALMRLFRMQVTAACANVRLHREAAHFVSLAKELDLASSVELALVPESPEGREGGLSWAGYFESSGDAASDFWNAYKLADGRVALVVGDAIGDGLAGSMIAAVVKSCADVIFEDPPADLDPGSLLGMLGRALGQRTESAGKMSCFAAFFDPAQGRVSFSNAAHPAPYVVEGEGDEVALGSLSKPGPLLGDTPDTLYPVSTRALAPGAAVVLFTDGLVGGGVSARAGERRIQRLLRKRSATSAAALRDAIVLESREQRARATLRDDAALVVVRVDVG
jgi:serine phosphatase RsbU (regulator of sigma subunit)